MVCCAIGIRDRVWQQISRFSFICKRDSRSTALSSLKLIGGSILSWSPETKFQGGGNIFQNVPNFKSNIV